jgi:hypothetical protein
MKTYTNNKLDSFYELDDNNITIKEYKLKSMKKIMGKSEVDKYFFLISKSTFCYA